MRYLDPVGWSLPAGYGRVLRGCEDVEDCRDGVWVSLDLGVPGVDGFFDGGLVDRYFAASQGGIVRSVSALELVLSDMPYIDALDLSPAVGDSPRFAISGGPPGGLLPLAVYRSTGVRDENRTDGCDFCFIYELLSEPGSARLDDHGGAIVELFLDETYWPPEPQKGLEYTNYYCMVTPLAEPICDLGWGGWFAIQELPVG
jgi:hypothetical protein